MNSLLICQQNRKSNIYFFATLFPFVASVILLQFDMLKAGFLFLILPILFLLMQSQVAKIYFIIAFFFIQKYSLRLADTIWIFPVDIVFWVAVMYYFFYVVNQQNKCDDKKGDLRVLFYPYLGFFIICIFSVCFNLYRYDEIMTAFSSWYIVKCLQLVLVIAMIARLKISDKTIEQIYDAIVFCAVLQFPSAFFQSLSGTDMTGLLTEHHSYLGTLLIIPFLLSLYKLISSVKNKGRKMISGCYLVSSMLILYMIYGTGSRSALVGLIVSLGLYVISVLFKRDFKMIFLTITIIVVVAFVSIRFASLGDVINRSFNNTESVSSIDISSLSRLLIWKYTWLNFCNFSVATKLFGIGIGTFAFLKQHFVIWNGNQSFTGAHMNVLHVLVETGIVGLLCFMMVFGVKIGYLFVYRKLFIAKIALYMTVALLFSGISQETFWFQPAFGTLWLFYVGVIAMIVKQICLKKRAYGEKGLLKEI